MDEMLRLLGAAPSLHPEEPTSKSPGAIASPAGGAPSRELLQPGDTDHSLPETGLSGTIEDAFDLIDGTSTLPETGTESPSSSRTSSQSRHAKEVNDRPPSSVVEDTELEVSRTKTTNADEQELVPTVRATSNPDRVKKVT